MTYGQVGCRDRGVGGRHRFAVLVVSMAEPESDGASGRTSPCRLSLSQPASPGPNPSAAVDPATGVGSRRPPIVVSGPRLSNADDLSTLTTGTAVLKDDTRCSGVCEAGGDGCAQ